MKLVLFLGRVALALFLFAFLRAGDAATKVELNTADAAALERVAGIGTDLANAVIASRPYQSIDDLSRVSGFTREKIDHLRGKVFVSAAPANTSTRTAAK